jgi:hypothetical protein
VCTVVQCVLAYCSSQRLASPARSWHTTYASAMLSASCARVRAHISAATAHSSAAVLVRCPLESVGGPRPAKRDQRCNSLDVGVGRALTCSALGRCRICIHGSCTHDEYSITHTGMT